MTFALPAISSLLAAQLTTVAASPTGYSRVTANGSEEFMPDALAKWELDHGRIQKIVGPVTRGTSTAGKVKVTDNNGQVYYAPQDLAQWDVTHGRARSWTATFPEPFPMPAPAPPRVQAIPTPAPSTPPAQSTPTPRPPQTVAIEPPKSIPATSVTGSGGVASPVSVSEPTGRTASGASTGGSSPSVQSIPPATGGCSGCAKRAAAAAAAAPQITPNMDVIASPPTQAMQTSAPVTPTSPKMIPLWALLLLALLLLWHYWPRGSR